MKRDVRIGLLFLLSTTVGSVGCGGANQNQASVAGENVEGNGETEGTGEAPADDSYLRDIQFSSAFAMRVDFQKYKTYAWSAIVGEINDPEEWWTKPDLNIAKELMFLIDRELRNRGWTEVTENPSALLAYGVILDFETLKVKIDPNGDLAFEDQVPAGALFVTVVDPETETSVWIGAAAAEALENPELEVVKKRLDYAVTKIMETLPK